MKVTVQELIEMLRHVEPTLRVSLAVPGTVYHELHEPSGPVQVYKGQAVIPVEFVDMAALDSDKVPLDSDLIPE